MFDSLSTHFIATYDDPAGADALRALADFVGRRGLSAITAVGADDLADFALDALPQCTPAQRAAYAGALRGLYDQAFRNRRVRFDVALSVGVGPLTLSCDRAVLERTIATHADDPVCASALERLAAYYMRMGKSPTDASRLEVTAFCRAHPADALWVGRLYVAARRLDLADAADLERPAKRYGARESAMRELEAFFKARDKGVLDANEADLAALLAEEWVARKRPDVERYHRLVRAFYRERLAADQVTPAIAIAAGVPPIVISPGCWELRAFIARHPQENACGSALRRLATFLGDVHPLLATPDDLLRFERDSLAPRQGIAKAYRHWVAAFYRQHVLDGLVTPAQALAAGVDAFDASPDRDRLRASIAAGPPEKHYQVVLKHVAADFARRDQAPLAATPQQLQLLLQAAALEPGYIRLCIARLVARFYGEQHAAGRVGLRVAAAAGFHPLAISPDRDALQAFIEDRRSNARRVVPALKALARYCALRGCGPLTVADDDLERFYQETPSNHHSSVRAFYRAHPRSQENEK